MCHWLLIAGTLALSPAYAEDELGRLFFSPERRQHLDRQRQSNIPTQVEMGEDPTLTINGVVTRSSGKRTVWINSTAHNESDPKREITATPVRKEPGRVVIRTEHASNKDLRVGDSLNQSTGETRDLLEGGTIVRRPPKKTHDRRPP